MVNETILKKFKKMNKQSDVMGVIRTFYPNIDVTISEKSKKKS